MNRLIALVAFAFTHPLFAAPGDLDLTFGTEGKVITALGSAEDRCNDVALQSDGKIVVAGFSDNLDGSGSDFSVVRYNTNGTLDASFNGTGKVTTDFRDIGTNAAAQSLAIQADGKIIAAGSCDDGLSADIALARYNADGSVDPNFGLNGRVIVETFGTYEGISSVALQPDGKIVVAGHVLFLLPGNPAQTRFLIARLNPNGSLDATFGFDGTVHTAVRGRSDRGSSVAVQGDGKILVAGYSEGGTDFAVVRYNTDGSLDTSFNGTGKVTTSFGTGSSYAYGMVIQSDGRIVVVGAAQGGNTSSFALVRYNTDGSLDATFNGTGRLTTAFAGNQAMATDVAIQEDGKIGLYRESSGKTSESLRVERDE